MSDVAYRAGVVALAALGGAVIVKLSFCHAVDLPPLPPRPEPQRIEVARVTAAIEHDPAVYARQLAADSHALKIEPAVTPVDLARVFPYQSSEERFALEVRGKRSAARVLGLELALRLEKIEGTPHRQMVLSIRNTTPDFLAYRVASRPSRGTRPCHAKMDHPQNAVVLAPGERVRRSECIYKSGWRLLVSQVETMVVPSLSHHYLSAVPPPALGLDLLSARGHRPGKGRSACQIFHSAALTNSIEKGETRWRDLVDFYGRHPCQIFTFSEGYRAFEADQERPLPSTPAGP
jgi:hypothetical protein